MFGAKDNKSSLSRNELALPEIREYALLSEASLAKEMNCLNEAADKYIYQIRHLLARLASNNMLVEMGSSGQFVMLPKAYS